MGQASDFIKKGHKKKAAKGSWKNFVIPHRVSGSTTDVLKIIVSHDQLWTLTMMSKDD